MRGVLLEKKESRRSTTYEEDCNTEVEGLGGLPQGLVGELNSMVCPVSAEEEQYVRVAAII